MTTVLFVCLGNICRSPAAEGVLRSLAEKQGISNQIHIESCGVGAWHIGCLPDSRMRQAASQRGLTLGSRAQRFQPAFLDMYDYIFASDADVMESLLSHTSKAEHKEKIYLMTAFSKHYQGQEVPDPYYLGNGAFELVLDMLEESCLGFLEHLKKSSKSGTIES